MLPGLGAAALFGLQPSWIDARSLLSLYILTAGSVAWLRGLRRDPEPRLAPEAAVGLAVAATGALWVAVLDDGTPWQSDWIAVFLGFGLLAAAAVIGAFLLGRASGARDL